MWVPHDQGLPDVVWTPKIEHQCDDDQKIAEECRKNRGSDDRFITFDIEYVYRCGKREPAGRETNPAKHVKSDPDSPGELVGQIRRTAESIHDPQPRGIRPRGHQDHEHS